MTCTNVKVDIGDNGACDYISDLDAVDFSLNDDLSFLVWDEDIYFSQEERV